MSQILRNLTSFRYRSLFLKFLMQSPSKLLRFGVEPPEASRAFLIDQRKGTRGSSGELTAIVKPGEWLSAVVIMELNLELTQNLITERRSGREQHKFEFTCFFIIK
ncbi:hypothetical protein V8G54_023044, partial [Vigna mungo]